MMNVLLLLMIPLLVSGAWEAIGPEGGEVTAILQSTQNTDLLYALSGSNPTQVVRSLDGGFSWEAVSDFTSGTPSDMVMTSTGKLVVVGPGRTSRIRSRSTGLRLRGYHALCPNVPDEFDFTSLDCI